VQVRALVDVQFAIEHTTCSDGVIYQTWWTLCSSVNITRTVVSIVYFQLYPLFLCVLYLILCGYLSSTVAYWSLIVLFVHRHVQECGLRIGHLQRERLKRIHFIVYGVNKRLTSVASLWLCHLSGMRKHWSCRQCVGCCGFTTADLLVDLHYEMSVSSVVLLYCYLK